MTAPRLLEIRQRIDALLQEIVDLRAEETLIISATFKLPGPPLDFDDDGRTIRWPAGEVRLGGKSWLFVRTLWEGKGHRAKIDLLERVVWGKGGKGKTQNVKVGKRTVKVNSAFVPEETVKSFIKRLRNELEKGTFPYKILPWKDRETQEIQGFRMKCTPRVQK